MTRRTPRAVYPLVIAAIMPVPLLSAQNWTDRSEYDLVLAIRGEAASAKRLQLIEQWKQKYPKSELGQVRYELQLSAYETLGDLPAILTVAREMVANDERSFVGLYWLTILTPSAENVSPEQLNQAEQSAKRLLADAPDYFSPDRKPQGPSGADWEKQRPRVEMLAHRTLGWVQWQRSAYDAAEKEFVTALQIDPNQAEVSAWLGIVLALQKTPEKQLQAIWHLARACHLDAGHSSSPVQRGEARTLLERVYSVYHGDTAGLDAIGARAITAAMPPTDFKVETAQQVASRKYEDELARTNPQLLEWVLIRKQLEQPGAEENLQSLAATGLPRLKGYVISHTPATRPTEIVLGLQDANIAEIVLKLDAALPGAAESGTSIEFEAKPVSVKTNPFLLHAQGERAKVAGWPSRR